MNLKYIEIWVWQKVNKKLKQSSVYILVLNNLQLKLNWDKDPLTNSKTACAVQEPPGKLIVNLRR